MRQSNSNARRPRIPTASSSPGTLSLSDTLTASDAAVKAVGKVAADTVTASDAAARTSLMARSDTVTASDAIVKAPRKLPADTLTASDTPTRAWTANLARADTVTASDAATKATGKSQADTITASDALSKGVTLRKADTLTASDLIALAEAFVLSLSDTVTASDAAVRQVVLRKADTVTASDLADVEVFVLPFNFTFSQRLVQIFGEGLEVGLYADREIGGPPIAPESGQPHEPAMATYTVADALTIELTEHDRYYLAAEVTWTVRERGKVRQKREWRYYTFVA